jgi:ethanolamine utilization protein EutQ (cupin superfamily)
VLKSSERAQKFTSDDRENSWMQISGQPAYLSYSADAPEGFRMGLGFGWLKAGTRLDFRFPYDEVVCVTKGSIVVQNDGRELTIHQGEMVFLPSAASGVIRTEESCELAFVHYPNSEQAMREWQDKDKLMPCGDDLIPVTEVPR